MIFYFNIKFNFTSPSGKCVRLHVTTRYKLFREKEFLFFKLNILLKNCKIYQLVRVRVYLKIIPDSDLPSGMILSGSR
jgi:hypothetical protein